MLYCCTPFLEAMKFDLKFSNALLRSMNQGYEVRQNENVESDESDEFADFMHSSKSSQDQIERNKNTACLLRNYKSMQTHNMNNIMSYKTPCRLHAIVIAYSEI